MNVEIIKQVISDYLPDDIIVSKINVTENAGKLMVEIGWDLKDSKPEFKLPVSTSRSATPVSDIVNTPEFRKRLAEEVVTYPVFKVLEPSEYQKSKSIMFDGYATGPLFNLDQSEQCISMNDIKMSWTESNRIDDVRILNAIDIDNNANKRNRPGKTRDGDYCCKTRVEIDASNAKFGAKSIRDVEDEHILNELRKTFPVIDIDTRLKPVLDKVGATKGSDKYIDGLIRAGINPERAREMAGKTAGEIISGIDWAKPILETKTATTNTTTENPTGLVPNQPPGSIKFRRTEPDGYAVIGEDGKLVERKRFAKKPSEVVDEYKKAIETYTKRFNIRGKLPGVYNKGKRNAASLTPHDLPFSDPNRKISDVEIMLLSTGKFPKLIEVPNSILETLKTAEKQIGTPNRLTKVMFHLNAIKNVILGK